MRIVSGLLAACAFVLCVPAVGSSDAPFSHKRHAPLKLDCIYCHTDAKKAERAAYPTASICMTCHREIAKGKPGIVRLAALPAKEPVEPERSVYMLADFAFFSHSRHAAAKLSCNTCHGAVYEMEEVQPVLPMTMKACITCHKASHAATGCNKCHELGQ